MENNFEAKFAQLEEKIEKIYVSVEKTRKYIWWAFMVTVIAVVLPIIGLFFCDTKFFRSGQTDSGFGIVIEYWDRDGRCDVNCGRYNFYF